jgi:methylglutaconyl-CoA hydratase
MTAGITLVREGEVARVRLARADRRNALDEGMIAGLREAFAAIESGPDIRVVVIEGEGEAFCAGADLAWMRRIGEADRETNRLDALNISAMFRAVADCPYPVLARVHGAALGGGAGLAAAADIAVADSKAVFGFTEVRLGIVPAVISPFVLRKVGAGDARRYFLTGERFSAAEALRIGLVQAIAEPDALDTTVDRLIGELLAGGPVAQREVKGLIERLRMTGEEEQAGLTADLIARLRASEEGREGMRAFLERRAPSWAPRKEGR